MGSRDLSFEEAKDNFIEIDGQVYRKVGHANQDGYVYIGYNRRYLSAHRVVFLLNNGYLPEIVDHADGNPSNNAISNLRAATKSTNAMNKPVRADSKSGIKNVTWYKRARKWVVSLSINKKRKTIGYFADIELAELVATEARNKYHGVFANHGLLKGT
jgi:hypothetical protein